jgi:group I intron endonuclease
MPPIHGWRTGVYCWRNRINGKVYVGGAYYSFVVRFQSYRRQLPQGKCHNRYFQNAWNKYGARAFALSILERCAPDRVQERENYWLVRLKAADKRFGYNICPYAQSRLGVRHTAATRQKMSATKKALYQTRPGPRTGAVLSAETRAKIAASKKGSKASPEARAKMSASRKGKKMTPEQLAAYKAGHWSKGPRAKEIAAKIAAGNKGKPCSPEKRAKISATKREQGSLLVSLPKASSQESRGLVGIPATE